MTPTIRRKKPVRTVRGKKRIHLKICAHECGHAIIYALYGGIVRRIVFNRETHDGKTDYALLPQEFNTVEHLLAILAGSVAECIFIGKPWSVWQMLIGGGTVDFPEAMAVARILHGCNAKVGTPERTQEDITIENSILPVYAQIVAEKLLKVWPIVEAVALELYWHETLEMNDFHRLYSNLLLNHRRHAVWYPPRWTPVKGKRANAYKTNQG